MLQVYIAQPMQYLQYSEIDETRQVAEEYIKKRHPLQKVAFINGYQKDWEPFPALECLGRSLQMLAFADVAYFVPGWENSRGCQIEATCCDLYGIPWATIPE